LINGALQDGEGAEGLPGAFNTRNYLIDTRVGTTVEADIYSGIPPIGNLDTLSITVVVAPYQYYLPIAGRRSGSSDRSLSYSSFNADLQLAAGFVPYPYPLHEITGGIRE